MGKKKCLEFASIKLLQIYDKCQRNIEREREKKRYECQMKAKKANEASFGFEIAFTALHGAAAHG